MAANPNSTNQRDAVAVNNNRRTPVPRQINKTGHSCGHRLSAESRLAGLSLILYDRCQGAAAVRRGCLDRHLMAGFCRSGRPVLRPLTLLNGREPPFKLKEIWAIRIRLQIAGRIRDLALFNPAIDGKLRGCDLVNLRVGDVAQGRHPVARAAVVQRKTGQPVRFELTEQTRDAVEAWIGAADLRSEQFLFPSRLSASPHLSTRQYARIVEGWAS